MARKGRDLERLVRILEQGLASDDVVVTSPDFVVDKVTGDKREVDVTIRQDSPIGELLTIAECRDRSAVQDVTWIEQLATKAKDVGALRTIAVSSSGFSAGARLKAEYYRVALRTLQEISNENLQNWIIPSSLITVVQHHHIVGMKLFSDDPVLDEMDVAFDANASYFVHPNGNSFSANDLFNKIPNLPSYYPPQNDHEMRKKQTFPLDLRAIGFSFRIGTILVKINLIELTVELWNETQEAPSTMMFAYHDGEQRLVGGSKSPITIAEREFNVVTQTTRTEDGQTVKFTLQPKKESK